MPIAGGEVPGACDRPAAPSRSPPVYSDELAIHCCWGKRYVVAAAALLSTRPIIGPCPWLAGGGLMAAFLPTRLLILTSASSWPVVTA